MNKKYIYVLAFLAIGIQSSCDVVQQTATAILTEPGNGTANTTPLTNQDVVSGLKEALTVGIRNAVDITSVQNGFFNNANIKLPFPESADIVRQKAIEWGLEKQVNDIVLNLNRAAEEASKEAAPIFVNAIKNMSISDGFSILNGGEGAATSFLKNNTTQELTTAFAPKVQEAIDRVQLTKYWEPVISKYNMAIALTGGERIEADLNQYVTTKAIDGLFHMVENEENKIRKDPAARVTDILSRVFGSINN